MLLPSRCPACRTPGPAPCRACAAALAPAPPAAPPPGVDACVAVLAYTRAAARLLVAFKRRRGRGLAGPLADAMAARVPAGAIDVVTWAPTAPARRRRRGHDHAQVLARAVARRLRRPCRRLLVRLPGPAQEGRSRGERLAGPRFEAVRAAPGRVLVVDDVTTTGATLRAAAVALRGAGACEVRAVVVARAEAPTPLTGRDPP